MRQHSWFLQHSRGMLSDQPVVDWKEGKHIPINDPTLSFIVEHSVKKALLERGQNRETISLLKEIREQLQVIASEIKELKPYKEEFVVFQEISRNDAKKEISNYFEKHQKETPVGYGDLVRDLHLDLKLVVELCSELESEGLIV